ncbi:MAG: hypothetical protein ACI92B_001686 [Marinobacter maritimus]|jgi:hypothetical protein
MSGSVVQLAGSSKSIFSAWQTLRKSAEKDNTRKNQESEWRMGTAAEPGANT